MMLGFEEMIVRCVDAEAKVHIREAVRCYEAGAYRASIVSAHVSVCFDLIAKLRSLAAGGDAVAGGMVTRLDNLQQQLSSGNLAAIKGLLAFERTLLEDFRDQFDFFGTQEFEELSRLRADRNRCAHPTFAHDALPYAPPAELARLHIRSALTYVLSQPPRQGKAALASLRATVASPYFPLVLDEAVRRLRGSEIGTARDVLVRAFVDDLAFGWPDPAHPYHGDPHVVVALQAAVELHRPVALPRLVAAIEKLAKSGVADAVTFAAATALRVSEAGELVDEASQAVLRVWLGADTSVSKGKSIKRALEISWWRDSALAQMAILDADQIAAVTDPPPEMIRRAAEVYATATNWDAANALAGKVANPLADRYSAADIAIVFNASHNGADLRGSHGFTEFIRLLYDQNAIPNAALEALMDEHGLEPYKRAPQIDAA